jgi:putative alpha-1,2-mannosidase
VTIRPGAGSRAIEITSDGGDGANAPYISAMRVDGRAVSRNYLTHEELAAGARLSFTMAAEPDTLRGTDPDDAPYSFSDDI